MNFANLFRKFDDLIKSGQAGACADELRKLKFDKIPRSQLAAFCSLARRSGAPDISLRALRPIIRPNVTSAKSADLKEIVEYARALMWVGAYREASQLLSKIEVADNSEGLLSLAFLSIYKWDYRSAATQFETYLRQPDLSEYSILTARVNHLACLRYLNSPEFSDVFAKLAADLKASSHALLLANVMETGAQHLIENGEWDDARAALAAAKKLLSNDKGRNFQIIEKWQNILNALKNKSVKDLEDFRITAIKNQQWETLRSLDYFWTRIEPDNPWAERVYFGTPYLSFRDKLEKIRPFPNEFWLGSGKKPFDPWFPGVQEGKLSHRMIVLGLSDLYRPLTSTEIFSSLHEDEHFHIDSIEGRVRQSILRARDLIKRCEAPLEIKQDSGAYSLRLKPNARLLCRKPRLPLEPISFLFYRFASQDGIALTTEEWALRLGLSSQTAPKILNKATKAEILEKIRHGRDVKYQVPPLSQIETR